MLSNIDQPLACESTIDQFWNLESIGITDSPKTTNDDKALDTFERTVRYVDNRYFVSWPWKESDIMLTENYHLALGRLRSTVSKLKRNSQLLEAYATIIRE